jgi:signal transduction histidine kinase
MHATGHPILRESDTPGEYVGITIDTTERRRLDQEREQAENRLRRSEAYLAEAQRLSHTGSWAIDPVTGKIIYYSEEMFRIMGLEPTLDPPDMETVLQRFHPEDLPPIIEGIERTLVASKKSWSVMDQTTGSPESEALVKELQGPMGRRAAELEFRVVLPDGPLKYVRAYGHPILDKTGQLIEFFGTIIDVTEQKKAELERERLRQLEADLAHMNRISMLGELAASISHELKQPITAGIISAKTAVRWLAKEQPNVEKACQSATNAVKAGEGAAEIIDRLRSLYTKAPPRCEVLDGNKIIGELVEMLRAEADRCGVAIHTDLTADLPGIRSDRVQLQQVLMNLMLNAIEALRETGGSLSVKSRLNEEGLLQISVSDTGPGLPAMKEEQIFEPFFTTKPQGSGMGLAICRSIVESHGGRLWAAPNGDRGACFNFTLPVAN